MNAQNQTQTPTQKDQKIALIDQMNMITFFQMMDGTPTVDKRIEPIIVSDTTRSFLVGDQKPNRRERRAKNGAGSVSTQAELDEIETRQLIAIKNKHPTRSNIANNMIFGK